MFNITPSNALAYKVELYNNRLDWLALAILSIGVMAVGPACYFTASAGQCSWIFSGVGLTLCIVGGVQSYRGFVIPLHKAEFFVSSLNEAIEKNLQSARQGLIDLNLLKQPEFFVSSLNKAIEKNLQSARQGLIDLNLLKQPEFFVSSLNKAIEKNLQSARQGLIDHNLLKRPEFFVRALDMPCSKQALFNPPDPKNIQEDIKNIPEWSSGGWLDQCSPVTQLLWQHALLRNSVFLVQALNEAIIQEKHDIATALLFTEELSDAGGVADALNEAIDQKCSEVIKWLLCSPELQNPEFLETTMKIAEKNKYVVDVLQEHGREIQRRNHSLMLESQ